MNRLNRIRGICLSAALLLVVLPSAAQPVYPEGEPPFSLKQYTAWLGQQLAPHRVVYVAAPDDEEHLRGQRLGAAYLTEIFGIIHVSTLAEAVAKDAVESIDALIVTPTALAEASDKSRGWLAESYRHGMVVTFVNVTFLEHMRALKIQCGKGRAIALVDYPGDWAASYHFRVHSSSPATVNAVIEAYDDCGDPKSRGAGSSLSLGSSNDMFGARMSGLLAIAMAGSGIFNTGHYHHYPDKWGFTPVGYWQ